MKKINHKLNTASLWTFQYFCCTQGRRWYHFPSVWKKAYNKYVKYYKETHKEKAVETSFELVGWDANNKPVFKGQEAKKYSDKGIRTYGMSEQEEAEWNANFNRGRKIYGLTNTTSCGCRQQGYSRLV